MEMKASGQTKFITPTPIAMVGPTKEVIVAQTSAKTPIVPYIAVG